MSKLKVRNLIFGEGQPKICVSLIAKNFEELFAEAMRISKLDCDLIEWRADYFMYVNDITFMKKAVYFIRYAIEDKPLIFTFRTLDEGGGQPIDADYYFELNRFMLRTGLIDMIDIEFNLLAEHPSDVVSLAKAKNIKVLLSSHDFEGTPSGEVISERVSEMKQLGGDICKLAMMPHSMSDVLTILTVSNQLRELQPDICFSLIGMGDMGKLTRFAGQSFGSVLTFASNGRFASAPGQLPIPIVRQALNLLEPIQQRD